MLSFQPPLSPNRRKAILEFENLSKKRKLEDPDTETETEELFDKRSKPERTKPLFDIDLQLETPLPLEWQRCLDIQSGQIHFYNTRTHKRTEKDPRRSPEPSASPDDDHMSLDLQLNLPCESLRKHNSASPARSSGDLFMETDKNHGGIRRSPSWLAFEGDRKEMVATVCTRCHMLVMLCKSSPACPNCKFMHPPEQSPSTQFKSRCGLLY